MQFLGVGLKRARDVELKAEILGCTIDRLVLFDGAAGEGFGGGRDVVVFGKALRLSGSRGAGRGDGGTNVV